MFATPKSDTTFKRNPHDVGAVRWSPRYGRFLQPDPIGSEGGMNLYAYVANDPVNFTDPLGLEPQDLTCGSGACADIVIEGGGSSPAGTLLRSGGSAAKFFVNGPVAEPGGTGGLLSDVADALDNFAENYLKPPKGRDTNESQEDCVKRVAPEIYDLLAGGLSGVLAGAGFKSLYPSKSPGGGTSVISILSRDVFAGQQMSTRRFGTISLGGAVGRVLSKGSVVTGAAAGGFGVGKAIGANQICR